MKIFTIALTAATLALGGAALAGNSGLYENAESQRSPMSGETVYEGRSSAERDYGATAPRMSEETAIQNSVYEVAAGKRGNSAESRWPSDVR